MVSPSAEPTVTRGWVITYLVVVASTIVGLLLVIPSSSNDGSMDGIEGLTIVVGLFFLIASLTIAIAAPAVIAAGQRDRRLARRFPQAVVFGFVAHAHSKPFFTSLTRLDGLPAEQIRPSYYTAAITRDGIELWCGWRDYRKIFAISAGSISSVEMARRVESGRTNDGLLFTFDDSTPPLFTGVHGGAFGGTVVIKRGLLADVHRRVVSALS